MRNIAFLCGARDFHAMDWYKSSKEFISDTNISIVTDLIAGEGFEKIINTDDNVYKLLIIDSLLLKKQSSIGDKWRNILKLTVLPIQAILLARYNRKNPNSIYHAHSMYYLVLARLAGVQYVGTPQGSDILVKPYKSIFYKFFSIYGLRGAKHLTVDSVSMQKGILDLVNRKAVIIQNGIDVSSVKNVISNSLNNSDSTRRNGILSIRGFTKLYRIKSILKNRRLNNVHIQVSLIYPFYDELYKNETINYLHEDDIDYGRVDRGVMYKLMLESLIVISIPMSDSSPRSVYEAIFCGSPVAITYNSYYETLPDCMKSRIIIVDIEDKHWLPKAIEAAKKISSQTFKPSEDALEMFDQRKSFQILKKLLFEQNDQN